MSTFIVLLGPPGAGKGTQAQKLAHELGLVHVSSGDIFRENLNNETELGKKAKKFIERGDLVPDDLTIAMIKDRLNRDDCKVGALLDGFPRTPVQAVSLALMLQTLDGKVRAVPYIKVPPEILVERLSGRWTCRSQGHVYHERFHRPLKQGICDIDGSELYQREDDKPETVKNRINVYFDQTAPLIEYYRSAGLLIEIDGTASIEEVYEEMLTAVTRGDRL
jgi:adenylate kinase